MDGSPNATPWQEVVFGALRANGINFASYVPDTVLNPLLKEIGGPNGIQTYVTTREEEAVGLATGAYLGGMLPVVLMQSSGMATLPNALASLVVPYQIPLPMIVSERGTLGEFNQVQALPPRTMRPALDSLGIEHHTIRRLDEAEFIVDRSIKQALSTLSPVVLILSPLLTGGKVEKGHR